MEGLKLIPYIALLITIAGVIIGSSVISLDKFQDTVETCWNSTFVQTAGECACTNQTVYNATGVGESSSNMSSEGWAICHAAEGEVSIAEQLPTVAIIGVMVIIISIIAGVFVYLRYFQ